MERIFTRWVGVGIELGPDRIRFDSIRLDIHGGRKEGEPRAGAGEG